MLNGDRLSGSVESLEKGVLKYKTDYAGVIDIQWDQVRTLITEKEVVVLTDDERVISGKLTVSPDEGIDVLSLTGEHVEINEQSIAYINPEDWRLGTGTKRSGQVQFAIKADRGNAQKNEIDLDINYTARRKHDRFSFFGEVENDTSQSVITKDTWKATSKYDLFRSKKFYYSLTAFVEHDREKGLDLRYYTGPGIGYQFFESEAKNLRVEWGLMYTSSDFVDRDETKNIGTGWFIDYDQYLLQRLVQAYHRQSGLLSDRENMNIKSITGLRFPLTSGFLTSLELEANWDAETAGNTDPTELIYRFKLGYGW